MHQEAGESVCVHSRLMLLMLPAQAGWYGAVMARQPQGVRDAGKS